MATTIAALIAALIAAALAEAGVARTWGVTGDSLKVRRRRPRHADGRPADRDAPRATGHDRLARRPHAPVRRDGHGGVGCHGNRVEPRNPASTPIGETIGIDGIGVEGPGAPGPAPRAAFARPGPALLDRVSARTGRAMPPTLHRERNKGFGPSTLRAVLTGRDGDRAARAAASLFH